MSGYRAACSPAFQQKQCTRWQLPHLIVTDEAVLKETSVVKRIALHKKSARIGRVAQRHQHHAGVLHCTIVVCYCQLCLLNKEIWHQELYTTRSFKAPSYFAVCRVTQPTVIVSLWIVFVCKMCKIMMAIRFDKIVKN